MDHTTHGQHDDSFERPTDAQAANPDDEHPAHAGHGSPSGAGHDRHEGHSVAMFRDKFWLSLALTIPVVVWSPDLEHWLGYTAPSFPGSALIPPILGTIVFFYGGLVFLRGARGELADRSPGMMTLISLAILVAFVTSWAGTLGLFEVEIWWELAPSSPSCCWGTGWRCAPSPRHGALWQPSVNCCLTPRSGSRPPAPKRSRSARSPSTTLSWVTATGDATAPSGISSAQRYLDKRALTWPKVPWTRLHAIYEKAQRTGR